MTTEIWFQKYRPNTVEHYVFPSEGVRDFVLECIKNKYIPNLLLSGKAGTGKTTLAQILINEIGVAKSDVLRINASTESGIDTVRERISDFCRLFPAGDFKVVVLEEADGLSPAAQRALRCLSEDFTDTVKFIFTCNTPARIIEPIHSRCQTIHVDQLEEGAVFDQIEYILSQEFPDKEYTDDEIDAVDRHINTYYPDLRKIINSIQQSSSSGVIHPPLGKSYSNDPDDWAHFWTDPIVDKRSTEDTLRALLDMTSVIDDKNFEDMYSLMYSNIESLDEIGDNKVSSAELFVPIIAEHLYRAYTVADQQMNLDACIYRMIQETRG